MDYLTTVWVTHTFVGIHEWANAPQRRRYLRNPHRHLFHVRVEVEVPHPDRAIEFHDLLDVVRDCCEGLGEDVTLTGIRWLRGMSCEMIAKDIMGAVLEEWPEVKLRVDVSEDGEAGGSISTL